MFKKTESTPSIANISSGLQHNQESSQPVSPQLVDDSQLKEAPSDHKDPLNSFSDRQEDSIEDQILGKAAQLICERVHILVQDLSETQLRSFCQDQARQQYFGKLLLQTFTFSELTTEFKPVGLVRNQYSTSGKTISISKPHLLKLRKKVNCIEHLIGADYPSLRSGNENPTPATKLLFKNLKADTLENTKISVSEWKTIEPWFTVVKFDYMIIKAIEQQLLNKYQEGIINLLKKSNAQLCEIHDFEDRIFQCSQDRIIVGFWGKDDSLDLKTAIARFQELAQKSKKISRRLTDLQELNCKIKIP